MKKLGITGPRAAGKTTIFRAVAGERVHGEIATLAVSDPRLDRLADLHGSRKRVPVHIELHDVHAAEKTEAAALARLREVDAIIVVLPIFAGGDPGPSLQGIVDEWVIADLAPIEKRMERARKDPSVKGELPALEKASAALEEGRPLNHLVWDEPELAALSSISPITLKPAMAILNTGEDARASGEDLEIPSISLSGHLEAEVSGMDPAEAAQLLAAYGIESPSAERLSRASYELFDLVTFFTINEKETHAWELKAGSTVPQAAGHIHTDMERGFIRAEVGSADEVVSSGGWDKAKTEGKVKVEGKDYIVRDGDVIRIRFSV